MSEHGLKISQIIALLTTALAAGTFLYTLFAHGLPEICYGLLFLILSVTGFCAAVAYAVSLIWLLIFWIKNDRVGNGKLTFAAVFLPAIFFVAAAIIYFTG